MKKLKSCEKIIVKVGTSSVFDSEKQKIKTKIIRNICKQIGLLKKQGKQIMLVSSGAVGLGKKYVDKNGSIGSKQAMAAIGQIQLMNIYSKYFSKYKLKVAQFLISSKDLHSEKGLSNLKDTYKHLNKDIIPIINENDVVATEEITFGDNDFLATEILLNFDFNLMIFLTERGTLISKNKKIKFTNKYQIQDYDFLKNSFGFGGLKSKLECARKISFLNKQVLITKSSEKFQKVLYGKGDFTYFLK